jgi:hypothetical protein
METSSDSASSEGRPKSLNCGTAFRQSAHAQWNCGFPAEARWRHSDSLISGFLNPGDFNQQKSSADMERGLSLQAPSFLISGGSPKV